MTKIKQPMLLAALTLMACSTGAIANTLHSGIYEGLLLAVSPTGAVTGYYAEEMGEGVTRKCAFSLSGEASKDGSTKIQSWSSAVLSGTIVPIAEGVELTVPHGQQHDGCMNVLIPEIDTGLELDQIQVTHWIALAQATESKVRLYQSPDLHSSKHGWIIQGDIVGVISNQNNWSQVQFVNDDKSTIAWVQDSQIKPLSLPKKP